MRILIKYKNGQRQIGDTRAVIYQGNPLLSVQEEIDIDHATDEEFKALEKNPHNDVLIKAIENRRK